MWSEEIRNNLYRGLENDLDNKRFYNVTDYFKTTRNTATQQKIAEPDTKAVFGKIGYISTDAPTSNNQLDFTNEVKGISFSNKVLNETRINTVKDLKNEQLRIYKIDDLISANFVETTVIPLNTVPTNLSLVKRFDWKDVLFADVGTAFHMIMDRFHK